MKQQPSEKPYFYKRGSTGVLLVHGFTGTPYVFRHIARKLSKLGYTVSAPLLAGHGTHPEDLEKTNWQDWYQSLESAYLDLKKDCKQIVVVGVSFGANLTCLLAARHKPKTLILIGMPRWIHRHTLASIFTPIFRLFGVRYFKKSVERLTDDGALLGGPNYSYLRIPMKSVSDLFYVMNDLTDEVLSKLKMPTLVIQSNNDGLVQPKSGKYIFENLAATRKQLIWLSVPHHELHTAKNRKQIINYITDFINQ